MMPDACNPGVALLDSLLIPHKQCLGTLKIGVPMWVGGYLAFEGAGS
jgi:hypothetical protein